MKNKKSVIFFHSYIYVSSFIYLLHNHVCSYTLSYEKTLFGYLVHNVLFFLFN